MADELNEAPEEQILELTEEVRASDETQEPEADEELVVSFGDEAPPASEESNSTIREMRQALREKEARIKELEKGSQPQEIELGPKPTLESCEYDEERFEQELDSWKAKKSEADGKKAEAEKAQAAVVERYQAKVKAYAEQKDTLGVKDFAEAEAEVLGNLNQAQQSILIHGAENKAQLVYALGRHPEKLKALSSIADPIEFAFAAARLEATMKAERRRPSTSPESTVRGGSGAVAQPDNKLSDKLSPEEWVQRRREQIAKNRRR